MTSISDTNVVNAPGGLVELGYSIAPDTVVTATSVGSAQQLSSITFVSDGSPVLVEFSAEVVSPPTANSSLVFIALEVDGSTTNRIYWVSVRNSASAGNYLDQSAYAQERLVLSAGVHIIRTLAWASGGTNGVVHSGGNYSPAITRVSKIIQASQLIVQTPNAPLVTSLPSNAIDGQEVRYLADNTNGIIWNLRYRAGSSSAYKWEFIGGAEVPTISSAANTTSSTTFQTTNTPSYTLPLSGDYTVQFGCRYLGSGSNVLNQTEFALFVGASQWSTLINVVPANSSSGGGNAVQGLTRVTGQTANTILNPRYRSQSGYLSACYDPWVSAVPIRVSA